MISIFQSNDFKPNGKLTAFVTSPAWFAVALGILARELIKLFTDSQIAGWAVFVVAGYAVWMLVQNRAQTLADHEAEIKELKAENANLRLKIETLEQRFDEAVLKAQIDNSKKHNMATNTKGTSQADIEFFKSLLRWGGLPDEWKEGARERIEANKELCAYIDGKIPSDAIVDRLYKRK